MLRSIRGLEGKDVVAVDGRVGSIHDILFDDRQWTVRLLVVDTGGWLSGRRVVISPVAFTGVDWESGDVQLRLSREQVESSPTVDVDGPVTREHERAHYEHHGWPFYWGGNEIWGAGVTPMELAIAADHPGVMRAAAEEQTESEAETGALEQNPHLRSARDILDYEVEGTDGSLGRVGDLMIDDESWRIREIVVENVSGRRGESARLDPESVSGLDAEQQKIRVPLANTDVSRGRTSG